MPRDIPVCNGNILVAFDKNYILREFYFPHIGQESHTKGEPFRFGVWANGRFSWVPDGWEININYLNGTLVTDVSLVHKQLNIRIIANDLVDFHENIYVKKLTVENLSNEVQEVRIFLCHDFHIYGNDIGDTAVFRPEVNGLLHYKGERYFLINSCANNKCGIDQFATGNKEQGTLQGTWRDAEDGILSKNPVAQGSVDSVIAIHLRLQPKAKDICTYWICAGRNWEEVRSLNRVIWEKTPELILKRTSDYWKLWVDKEDLNYDLLPDKIARTYKRSLLIIRTQIDNNGTLVAHALDLAGYLGLSRSFFDFCLRVIEREGYFLHKYTPYGALASSWHPWLDGNERQLPIQEGETALVVWALWKHYNIFRDIEFIRPLYKPLIKNAADFMLRYRDKKTKLPLPSYDLWEERYGVHAFTLGSVFGGLMAAANFAEAFGEIDLAERYKYGALEIKEAMSEYLYLEKERRFARMVKFKKDGKIEVDNTLDAGLCGIFMFGAYDVNDEKVTNTMRQIYEKLWCKTDVGGVARYENDPYYRVSDKAPGNPWFVTTLWLAQYYIAQAKTQTELDKAIDIMEWVAAHALPSGVLAEQVNPYTNEPVSVSPLTWSHATFIVVVQEYLNKLLALEKCEACGRPKYSKKRNA